MEIIFLETELKIIKALKQPNFFITYETHIEHSCKIHFVKNVLLNTVFLTIFFLLTLIGLFIILCIFSLN